MYSVGKTIMILMPPNEPKTDSRPGCLSEHFFDLELSTKSQNTRLTMQKRARK